MKWLKRFGEDRNALHAMSGTTWGGAASVSLLAFVLTSLFFFMLNALVFSGQYRHLRDLAPVTFDEFVESVRFAEGVLDAKVDPSSLERRVLGFRLQVFSGSYADNEDVSDRDVQLFRRVVIKALGIPPDEPPEMIPEAIAVLKSARPSLKRALVRLYTLELDRMIKLARQLGKAEALPGEVEGLDLMDESNSYVNGEDAVEKLRMLDETLSNFLAAKLEMKKTDGARHYWDVLPELRRQLPTEKVYSIDRVFRGLVRGIILGDMGNRRVLSFVLYLSQLDQTPADSDPRFVMEVANITDRWGDGIGVRYYIYDMGPPSRALAPDPPVYMDAIRRHSAPGVALRPVSVVASERQLAESFFRFLSIRAAGADIKINPMEPDERKRLQAFIERILVKRLGRSEPGGSGPSDRIYEPMESWTAWSRRFNGSNWWGIIQFLSVFAFNWVVVAAIAQAALHVLQRNDLNRAENQNLFGDTLAPQVDLSAMVLALQCDRRAYLSRHLGADSDTRWMQQYPAIALALSFYEEWTQPDTDRSRRESLLDTQAKQVGELCAGDLVPMGYITTIITSLGFLGTVAGIGNALLEVGRVTSIDTGERQAAIQAMSMSLSIAFDTTFIALVLSMIATLLYYLAQRSSERVIVSIRHRLQRVQERLALDLQ